MPTWAIVLLNVAAVAATVLAAAAIYFRSKSPTVAQVAAQPQVGQSASGDNAKLLAEVGKALDLYSDLIAAGKTPEEARTALAPVVQTLAFPVQSVASAPTGAAK